MWPTCDGWWAHLIGAEMHEGSEDASASERRGRGSAHALLLLLLSWFSPTRCPTLFDPIDGSPPGSAVPGILQARTLEWVAISFSIAWKWKVKVKSLSRVRLFETPWTAAYEVPLSMGFSRQEYWSGLPLPSPLSVANYHLTGNCTNTPHKRRSIVSPLSALKHLKFGKPRRYHLVEQRLAQLILFSTNYILVLNNNLPFSLGRTGYWILCVC